MRRATAPRPGRRLLTVLLLGLCATLGTAGQAQAASTQTPSAPAPGASVASYIAAWSGNRHVVGHRLTPRQAILLAARTPKIESYWRAHPSLTPAALPYRSGADAMWEISWFDGNEQPEIYAAFDERGDRVNLAWTGTQAEWTLARGYPWYSGNLLGRWFVWLPLCLLFLVPFVDRRRLLRLLHLDLLALLGFSVSFFLFESGTVSASVPLVYPVLAYLLVRMLWSAFRPSARREPLVPYVGTAWLLAGIAVLVVLRIVANLTDSTVLDVGSAGAAGAHLLLHGGSLYNGSLGRIIIGGDTYGPVNYLAYVPFAALFPHDRVAASASAYAHHPSAQLAALCFDLLTLAGLILLGRRLRVGAAGTRLGLALGYAWVAYPFTALTLQENTNDSLIAALLVFTLLVLHSPARRGVMLALGTMAKFVPVILVPLIATGPGPRRLRSWATFGVAFGLTACIVALPVVSPGELHAFYHLTLGSQLHRTSPFSLWGQHASLGPLRRVAEVATVLFAIALAFLPARRTPAQVAALAAVLVIAIELCVSYWYYTYIVWFAPLVLVALFAQYLTGRDEPQVADLPEGVESISEPVAVPELVA